MKGFSKNFLKQYKFQIFGYSLLRIFSFAQVLFWPFAFAKVVNIMTESPDNWHQALVWAGLMLINKVLEDIIRLRSKYGLETIATELKIKLAIYLTEETKIRKNVKTGEAVQAIKTASETVETLMMFYKESVLQLPVNFIVIPMVLLKANVDYLFIFIVFAALYLLIEYFASKSYRRRLESYLKSAEVFWGTTYRKAPDIWRKREKINGFSRQIESQGKKLDRSTDAFLNTNNWRWIATQTLSSAAIGLSILFIIYKTINGSASIGDLILVTGYLSQVQGSLNIVSSGISYFSQTKLALNRLYKAIEFKSI